MRLKLQIREAMTTLRQQDREAAFQRETWKQRDEGEAEEDEGEEEEDKEEE